MLVYSARHQCLNQFNSIESDQYTFTNDRDVAFASTDIKIGIFDFNWIQENASDPRLDDFKKIIVVGTEMWYNDGFVNFQWISNVTDFVKQYPNWHFFLPGDNDKLDNQYFYPHWFGIAWHYSNRLSGELDLVQSGIKPKLFDCLLGLYKPHRSYVYYRLLESGLLDQSICSYGRGGKAIEDHIRTAEKESPDFIKNLYLKHGNPTVPIWIGNKHDIYNFDGSLRDSADENLYGSAMATLYKNYIITISNILPIDIYNQSAYSIVTETAYNYNFYTEKIVKPILGKRLFVVFAAAGYLKGLHSVGVKTFGDIIDESYDLEQNDETRWSMAIDQIKKLASMDQATVLSAIQDRVEYNQRLMLDTNWQGDSVKKIQEIIASI